MSPYICLWRCSMSLLLVDFSTCGKYFLSTLVSAENLISARKSSMSQRRSFVFEEILMGKVFINNSALLLSPTQFESRKVFPSILQWLRIVCLWMRGKNTSLVLGMRRREFWSMRSFYSKRFDRPLFHRLKSYYLWSLLHFSPPKQPKYPCPQIFREAFSSHSDAVFIFSFLRASDIPSK